ncbi:pyridoxamine 5'-phosphate oxidase family protein [Mesorhizobium sp. KR9-304]|uniref:pyridoxamine 5'-phosphate oxidase family protein n=1 Tax=Mesorhizobium sp. KR9-304 TaxID=3156614 RepID=UPI0032B58767
MYRCPRRIAACPAGLRAGRPAPYLVPIHYAYAAGFLYSFSLPGQKIEWMRTNPRVCVQVDQFFGEHRKWRSVLVFGAFEELLDRIGWKRERDHAWSLREKQLVGAWCAEAYSGAGTSSHLFYRIKAERMTGRRTLDDTADS